MTWESFVGQLGMTWVSIRGHLGVTWASFGGGGHLGRLESIGNPWKPFGNPWKPLEALRNFRKPPETLKQPFKKKRKPSQTIGDPWKSLETLWKPLETLRNPWKPSETFGNLQKTNFWDEMGRDYLKIGNFDTDRCGMISGPRKSRFRPMFPEI